MYDNALLARDRVKPMEFVRASAAVPVTFDFEINTDSIWVVGSYLHSVRGGTIGYCSAGEYY
jgi:hypothetical protein